jgi:hypothetical protein
MCSSIIEARVWTVADRLLPSLGLGAAAVREALAFVFAVGAMVVTCLDYTSLEVVYW